MPRPKDYYSEDVVLSAMELFWAHGYYSTSINDLVNATGVNRHGLYAEFGDKRGLFIATMKTYFNKVVTPAFQPVEAKDAGLNQIANYFEHQIQLAVKKGLPGPGCLVANTMVESGPHDDTFQDLVKQHTDRLYKGFRNALQTESRKNNHTADINALAHFTMITTQGLWSFSRTTSNPKLLRQFVKQLISTLEEKLKL